MQELDEVVVGDHRLDVPTRLTGTVTGDLLVAGGGLHLPGMVIGSVVVEEGDVLITGTVGHDVINRGGRVRISGNVTGHVYGDSESTRIDPGAQAKLSSEPPPPTKHIAARAAATGVATAAASVTSDTDAPEGGHAGTDASETPAPESPEPPTDSTPEPMVEEEETAEPVVASASEPVVEATPLHANVGQQKSSGQPVEQTSSVDAPPAGADDEDWIDKWIVNIATWLPKVGD